MKQVTLISLKEWDDLVTKTYGKPYSFQQQDGCRDRGIYHLQVPCKDAEDYENTELPEVVNHEDQGIKFSTWLERDPKQLLKDERPDRVSNVEWDIALWWDRNFYPSVEILANDLHEKGLLAAGEYVIEIDW